MDKPTTLSIKDWIVRKMSTELSIQERILHAVIGHQFDRAREAMETCYSVEFSGWGKYMFNKKRAYTKLGKFSHIKIGLETTINNIETDDKKRGFAQYKLGILMGEIKMLKRKLNINENQS